MKVYVETNDINELEKIDLNAELDACPFCGYTASLEYWESRKGYEAGINCNNCNAQMFTVTYDTYSEAINAVMNNWNSRV